MSGCNYDSICPVCGSPMDCYSDHNPFDHVGSTCLNCGFYFYTKTDRMSLKAINSDRELYNSDFAYKPGDPEFLKPIAESAYNSHTKKYDEL